jgi:hypothetical protein
VGKVADMRVQLGFVRSDNYGGGMWSYRWISEDGRSTWRCAMAAITFGAIGDRP